MITAHAVELRIGARVLLTPSTFRIAPGDRIGLVGRNGAGKTTLTKTLAGETQPTGGQITRSTDVGYLPQDPRTGDLETIAMDRVLSARGLDYLVRAMAETEARMSSPDMDVMAAALERYPKLEARFQAAGGYAAESEAHRITSNLGLDQRVLAQPLETLSGGQRRRVELARILFSGVDTLLLDEPTNHLDADSITWLRDYLKSYPGGFIVISHSVELLRDTVNKVWHLDANRGELDQYNLGWDKYLEQREQDEKRRRRERANAEKKASALMAQAEKMRAKATKAVAAQNMIRRAETMLGGLEGERQADRVAKLRFPKPAPSGRTPLTGKDLSKSYGSLEVFAGVDLAIDRGSRVVILGLNGAGKTTMLRLLAGVEQPDTGAVEPGHGLKLGYYAQEHDMLDMDVTVVENLRHAAPDLTDTEVRSVLGSFLFSGDDADKPTHVLSGGEKTRLALATLVVSSANVLLLDEPTNNLDPASRAEILGALHTYEGAIVMVTHDDGAVDALNPERVLLLPDGDEDLWNDGYRELVSLA
ncbi:ABC transporter related protein [Xylanimonas cellulosilytica DSM 15894]|uniref:ABC transporter related protein n=1 Tax=Xylanimonas cellulosilytica (strain DSM 15894 / JCM 12276 / CECT 5975 / KCTC 9989 / LMG 20990 / NBRC 107835 / XIL07) TaxID=446471 RepID=D1BRI7_XYLCX|nr:ABC-F family ATP-binding cassette domain-containing protein [Xylanimonas cellulosilytica]ACZ30442.1 ABC transporter related protein [Xylanimonas cellulosilytica DSM 15894]